MTSLIPTRQLNRLARLSGLVRRRRKIDPMELFWTVVLGFGAGRARTQPRRVVVLRKREMDQPQGHLFDACGGSYSLFVTNLDWPAEEVPRFYDKRADVGRTICEVKNDLHIDHVSTASFGANAADLALKILARNLLMLYRDRGLGRPMRERVMTLRRRYFWVAGRLVRRSGQLLLRLAEHGLLRHVVEAAAMRC